jgi:hypothetical protein
MHKVQTERWMETTFPAICRDGAQDILGSILILQFLDHRATLNAKGHWRVQAMGLDFLSTGNEWLVHC